MEEQRFTNVSVDSGPVKLEVSVEKKDAVKKNHQQSKINCKNC
jgi:hypothetical protein